MFFTLLLLNTPFLIISCNKDDETPPASEQIETNIKMAFDSIIENTNVPGLVVGIWAPDEGIDLVYSAGVADLDTKAPMDPEMVFRIASNTKTFAITVLLQLVDEGSLSLDDKLSQYLPDFPRGDEVSIEMLTNMRSGIFNYVTSELFWTMVFEDPTHFWTVDEIIDFVLEENEGKLYNFDPGTGFSYSNSNTIIAQYIVEKVTSSSLEFLINQRIIVPLNLDNTMYVVGGCEIPGYHSKGYYFCGLEDEYSECFDYSFAKAAGCMISNIYDLKTYVIALTGDYFLSPELQAKRMNEQMQIGTGDFKYGMGIMGYKAFSGHNGGAPGYTSLMMHSKELNCTFIMWYNCNIDDVKVNDLLPIIPKLIYPDL